MAIADLRREYNLAGLRRSDLHADPISQFKQWFDQQTGARLSGRLRKSLIRVYKSVLLGSGAAPVDINAMTLATVDKEGRPSARVVLLKGVDSRGFIFFTNYESRKGQELDANPHAALVFYWPHQERQVTVAGKASKIPAEESAEYFASRPRGSQIGAWASDQSKIVKDRGKLEERWRACEAKYPGQVPLPPYWGGYVLSPERIEFWQGRPNRLHDRFRYTRISANEWSIARLSP
jgi:pyridoxamine 5'-phosphate oxidase